MPEYLVTAATPEPAAAGLATLDVAAPAARASFKVGDRPDVMTPCSAKASTGSKPDRMRYTVSCPGGAEHVTPYSTTRLGDFDYTFEKRAG